MAMVVKNNMSAVSTLNTLNKNSSALQKSLAKVSSGMKINSAQDDASGYAISEKMRVQIRSLDQANQNTQNASSMMKTAEGAVSSTVEILKSLKEKAINAATDTNTDSDRKTIQKELDQFIDQIDDNALTTFNGKYLVDGSKSQYGEATYTKMTNQSLQTGTDGSTALTALHNRNNESLEIENTDYVTASYVKNGETYTTKFKVGGNKLEDIFNALDPKQKIFAATTGTITDPTGTGGAISPGGQPAAPTSASGLSDDKLAAMAALTDSDAAVAAIQAGTITSADITALQGSTSNLADKQSAVATAMATAIGDTSLDTTGASGATSTNATKISEIGDGVANDMFTVTAGGSAPTGTGTQTANNDYTTITATSVGSDITAVADAIAETAVSAAGSASSAADAATAIAGITNAIAITNSSTGNASTANYKGATVGSTTGLDSTATEVTELATAVIEDAARTAVSGFNATDIQTAVDKAGGTTSSNTASQTSIVMATTAYIGKNSAGDDVNTADGTEGLTISSKGTGVQEMVAGVTISITDSEGNVKKSANAALDDFTTTIYAKNKSDRNELTFQVGAAANQSITVGLDDMRSEALGLKSSDGAKVSVATQDNANAAIKVFDNAIQKALDQQTTIGAVEARLEYTSNNLTTSSENVQAAESTIRDADMAKEMTAYTKNNVLLQAAQSMLAQANQSSSQVLSLLQ